MHRAAQKQALPLQRQAIPKQAPPDHVNDTVTPSLGLTGSGPFPFSLESHENEKSTEPVPPLQGQVVGSDAAPPPNGGDDNVNPLANVIVQRSASQFQPSTGTSRSLDTGGGRPMAISVQTQMEKSFAHDFSSVRVHEGQAAPSLGAVAFIQGEQVHFAPGTYSPEAKAGQRLLGHELAHVVQQGQGRVTGEQPFGAVMLNSSPVLEAEADRAGDRVARGEPVGMATGSQALSRTQAPVQRKIIVAGSEAFSKLDAFEKYRRETLGDNTVMSPEKEASVRWLLRDSHDHEFIQMSDFHGYLSVARHAVTLLNYRFNMAEVEIGGVADFIGNTATPFMIQTPQMRGDMHDVRAAMALYPTLKLIFCMTGADRIPDAGEILSFYSGLEARIALVAATPGDLRGPLAGYNQKGMADATSMMAAASARDAQGTRAKIKEAITGNATEAEQAKYRETLKAKGFVQGAPYCIVNYRDSGHKPEPGRDPSHPELDTGVIGLRQIMDVVGRRGFIPVPMGSPPGGGWDGFQPNLLNYFLWDCCKPIDSARNKRQAEYGLLRYLAEHFNVRALSMRSGVTDALVFAGIETISLDVVDDEDASWQRAGLRDAIMPGTFHQGFFTGREDAQRGERVDAWRGEFTGGNLKQIDTLVGQFFGDAGRQKRHSTELDPTSPFANPRVIVERLTNLVSLLKRVATERRLQDQVEFDEVSSKSVAESTPPVLSASALITPVPKKQPPAKKKVKAPESRQTKALAQRVGNAAASLKYFKINYQLWEESQKRLEPQVPFLNMTEDLAEFGRHLEDVRRDLDDFGARLERFGEDLEQFSQRVAAFGKRVDSFTS